MSEKVEKEESEEESDKNKVRGILSLDLRFIKIDDVIEFVRRLHDATKVKLDDKSKKALEKAIKAIQNNLELISKDLKPFYDLPSDEQAFKSAFRKAYGDLSTMPLEEFENKVSRCHEVYDMIDTLRKSNEWRTYFSRTAEEKLDTLQNIADRWLFNDKRATEVLTQFHEELTKGIENIFKEINKKPVQDSINDLDTFLVASRPKYLEVATVIDQLMNIKKQI